jgi:hypothetical protein
MDTAYKALLIENPRALPRAQSDTPFVESDAIISSLLYYDDYITLNETTVRQ